MWEVSVNFKDVIDIDIQLNSFDYKVKVIHDVIIERFVDYIKNFHFEVDYFTIMQWISLFQVKYFKNLGY